MRLLPILILLFLPAQLCVAAEAQAKFQAIVEEVNSLVQETHSGFRITRSPQYFTASFDTMDFTVHSEVKTGEYLPNVHREIGPKRQGFVLQLSLQPVNSAAAVTGQTRQRSYWKEYLWQGHADKQQQVHIVFKFGEEIDKDFKDRIIKTVKNISLGHAPALPPLALVEITALLERFERRETIEKETLHRALISCQSAIRLYAAKALGETEGKTSLPFLIDALSDESFVVGATWAEPGMETARYWANESLEKLTSRDFGYKWDDSFLKRHEAVKKWAAWYKQEQQPN